MTHRIFRTGIIFAALSLPTAASAQVTEAGADLVRTELEASIGRVIERLSGAVAEVGPASVTVAGDQ